MNTTYTVLKGILWGVLLLAAILLTLISYVTTKDTLSNFKTAEDFVKEKSVYEKTKPKFENLVKLLYEGNKLEFTNEQYENLNDVQKAYYDLLDEHNKLNCKNDSLSAPYRKCGLYTESANYVFGYNNASNYDFLNKINEGRYIVEGLAKEENFNKHNNAISVALAASI